MTVPNAPAAVLAIAVALGACSASVEAPEASDTESIGAPDRQPVDEPELDALRAAVDILVATTTAARDQLETARQGGDRDAAATAVALLTADERLRTVAAPDLPPLLPGPETSRQETIDYGDAFTLATEAARDAGGALGGEVARVLGDTIAGDVGAWQRDAEGVLDAVDDVATGRDVPAAEPAVLALAGEGTRALAWALFAARGDDPATVTAAAERALAHLDLILSALRDAAPTPTETEGP